MSSEPPEPAARPRPPRPPSVGVAVARYGGARLALVALIAAGLVMVGVPLLVAALVALVAAVPLSQLLFAGLRRDLDVALATGGARRSAHRARLRAQLRGEQPPL